MPRLLARTVGLLVICSFGAASLLQGQDLDSAQVRVPLDSALHLAQRAALTAFPELPAYTLFSVSPRALKGDARGLHWQVLWQERAFPHRRWLVARVYMSDGSTTTERE